MSSVDDKAPVKVQRPFVVDSRINVAVNRGANTRSAFIVDDRIHLKLEYDLAIRLGEAILAAHITDDTQLVALGHRLDNLKSEDE